MLTKAFVFVASLVSVGKDGRSAGIVSRRGNERVEAVT